ncbi:efflux RND transporter periplasmic adaptor subunit [Pseudooceanicola sp. 216_PA32_1]|jgi:RND family efflux transporter MFP subunit|uniref:Efflux RND transporter periplasmic adaptor subunit n=1 Tax=Pseudooceanicola pacificus TaxID=2676438 RepID=A0A844VYG8_9RHOB|nr:efflux RND transporter periplasmic adaptor subunit [Pseudooceanicola pacificus]MWB76776.1 efflux RND transporter periplasmic adaptor subunit [Pseudooceanicola pacificus]
MFIAWLKSGLRQLIVAAVVIAGTLALWIMYVPAAQPWLEQAGIYDMLGIDPAQAAEAPAQASARRGGGASRVIAAEVGTGTLNDRITAIGDGRAVRSVSVKAEASGRIVEIGFAPGEHVEEGSTLFRLDDRAEVIALDRARLMLSDAQSSAERLERLRSSGAASVVAMHEAELELRTAELAVRQAEFDLERRTVVAPISGWMGILEYEVGDRTAAQDNLAVIADRSEILIDFRVPERVLPKLSPGMPLTAEPLALGGVKINGEVSAIDNVIDRNSRTIRVLGRLANEGDRLRDGMALSVSLAFPGEQFPSVDPLAVQWSSDGAFVWVVRDGKAQRVAVQIRQRNAADVLVSGDLKPGDRVVIEGVQTLRPGADVAVEGDAAAMGAATPAPTQKL